MTVTLHKNQSGTYSLPAGSAITIVAPGQALVENFGSGDVLISKNAVSGEKVIGPFANKSIVKISALAGNVEISDPALDHGSVEDSVIKYSEPLFSGFGLESRTSENRLVCIDAFTFLALTENSSYIFGRASDSAITRVSKSDSSSTTGVAITSLYVEDGVTLIAAGNISHSWAWDDFQLCQVYDLNTGKSHLYKSVDNYTSVGNNAPLYNNNMPVYSIGYDVGRTTVASLLNIMAPWSLTRATNRRGEDLIVFGQYNVNTSRVAGGSNDWSNVLCSRDNGDTWEVILEMNTAGSNIVRHCHAVQFDPYEKEFWIQYGDAGTSAIYVWDGVSPIPANTPANQASRYKGWRGMDVTNSPIPNPYLGQVTTLVFLPDEVIAPIDHGFTDARGIYKLSKDLSVFEKLTDPGVISQPVNHSMYSSTMCPLTKTILVSTLIESTGTDVSADYTLWVWAATKDGNYRDWKRVARYMLDTSRDGGRSHSCFQARPDGTIWIGSSNGAGKNYHSTTVCKIDGIHSGDEEVIHPVYWIDPVNGSDANDGYSPSTAWATAGHALRVNRVTLSCLVNVEPGRTSEGSSSWTLGVAANARKAQTNYPVIVRGKGRKRSGFKSSSAAALFVQGTTKVDIHFDSISIENQGPIFDHGAGVALNKVAKFTDVYIKTGGSGFNCTGGRIILSGFYADVTTRLAVGSGTGDFAFEAESGISKGGQTLINFRGNSASECRIENVVGINQSVCGVDVLDTAVILPTVRNVAIDANVPVVRDSRTVKTSASGKVEYNIGRSASTGLVDGDAGSKTVADLMLIGTSGAPKPNSPLIGSGNPNVGPLLDINGDAFGTTKNVGAFA